MQRTKVKSLGVRAAVLLVGSLPIAALADDPTINRMLASQCSQCHGTNGYAVGDIDPLAGESVREIREELNEMRFEGRPDDIMDHQALGYTDDQIRRIAEYFASVPERRPPGAPAIRLSASGSSPGDQDPGDEGRDEDQDEDRDRDRDEDHARDRDRDEDRYTHRARDRDDDRRSHYDDHEDEDEDEDNDRDDDDEEN
jgi:sulfide dehydrogenase cytochrome subunit